MMVIVHGFITWPENGDNCKFKEFMYRSMKVNSLTLRLRYFCVRNVSRQYSGMEREEVYRCKGFFCL